MGSGCRKAAHLWALELSPWGGPAGGVSTRRAAKEAGLWAGPVMLGVLGRKQHVLGS